MDMKMRLARFCNWITSCAALVAVVLILLFQASAHAQLPSARLTSIFPPGGKVGATVEATATGADLDDATEIRFNTPGITAKAADEPGSETDRKFTITISPDVAPGNYQARIVGRYGISNPRGFVVGDMPELVPAAKAPDGPVPLPLDTVANGRTSANAVDQYSLELKQGQRVIIVAAVRELDSKLIPVMTLNGPQGSEVARGRRGELIDYTVQSDGAYTLSLHDLLYKGGPEYFYRLTASTRPYLDAIYPPVASAGAKGKFTLLGRNLPGSKTTTLHSADGKPLEQLDVDIDMPADPSAAANADTLSALGAAGAGIDAIAWRLKSDKGVSNPVLIAFAKAPVLEEQEPNDSPEQAQKLTAPCEVVGRFYPHGDRDIYTFDAEKGSVYWIEIISTRLGQHTSPELLVQTVGKTDKGAEKLNDVQDLGGPDMQPMGKRGGGASPAFPAQSRDVEYRLEAKDAATYRLTVRDLFDATEDNAALGYCMVIHKQTPDFHLVASTGPMPTRDGNNPTQDPSVFPAFLRKGGTAPLRVNVLRQDGFDEDVQVDVEGLPPGVHCTPVVIPSGENTANLMLTADDNAGAWNGSIKIVGKAKVDDQDITHVARVGAVTWPRADNGNGNIERTQARLCSEMPLAVSADETEPLTFEIPQTSLEVKANEKLHLAVKIKRHMEMKQPVKVQFGGFFRQGNAKLETIAPGSDSATLEVDIAQQRLSPGTYTFYVQAQTQMKYDRKTSPEKSDKANGGKKRQAGDSLAFFYSQPIIVKVLAK
jgi:hypothetical protein